jgi:hypothetical protein
VKIDSFCTEQAQQSRPPASDHDQGSENGMARGAMKRGEIGSDATLSFCDPFSGAGSHP